MTSKVFEYVSSTNNVQNLQGAKQQNQNSKFIPMLNREQSRERDNVKNSIKYDLIRKNDTAAKVSVAASAASKQNVSSLKNETTECIDRKKVPCSEQGDPVIQSDSQGEQQADLIALAGDQNTAKEQQHQDGGDSCAEEEQQEDMVNTLGGTPNVSSPTTMSALNMEMQSNSSEVESNFRASAQSTQAIAFDADQKNEATAINMDLAEQSFSSSGLALAGDLTDTGITVKDLQLLQSSNNISASAAAQVAERKIMLDQSVMSQQLLVANSLNDSDHAGQINAIDTGDDRQERQVMATMQLRLLTQKSITAEHANMSTLGSEIGDISYNQEHSTTSQLSQDEMMRQVAAKLNATEITTANGDMVENGSLLQAQNFIEQFIGSEVNTTSKALATATTEQVTSAIKSMSIVNDKTQIKLSLFPESLGHIQVEIMSTTTGGERKIQSIKVIADNRETLVILEQSRLDLVKKLQEVAQADSDTSLEFEMNQQNQQNESGNTYSATVEEMVNWRRSVVTLNVVQDRSVLDNNGGVAIAHDNGQYVTQDGVNIKV